MMDEVQKPSNSEGRSQKKINSTLHTIMNFKYISSKPENAAMWQNAVPLLQQTENSAYPNFSLMASHKMTETKL
jgi:hypothetical protein